MDLSPSTPIPASAEPVRAIVRTPFFAVSLRKFVVMSLCTGGVYEIYWLYRNWALVREREPLRVGPALRAFFGFFSIWPLLVRIRDADSAIEPGPDLPAGACAAGWIVASMAAKAPDPYWLVCLLAFVFLLPAQMRVNRINAHMAPGHDRNDRFSAWNGAAIAIGGLIILAAIVGAFLPGDAP